ncbi:MAG: DUF4383 domain-containing protein [Actinobacteria bacterium]|nr:MAG: DUF4383 domain-containing protein [Actinomycetota bacterium]TML83269.1 MAG: DUF4383 domain-containing protein [Actinomycetota bacterium]
MNGRTPAQLYALLVGGTLVIAGIIGFFYSAKFGSPGKVRDVFGILSVNGWHNVVHIVTGAAGLLALGYAARAYAGVLGVVYIGVAAWGFILGNHENILGFLPVNTEDDVLHALLGVTGVAAYLATPAAPSAARPAPAT